MKGVIIKRLSIHHLDDVLNVFRSSIHNTDQAEYDPQQLEAWSSSAKNTVKWEEIIQSQYIIGAFENGRLLGFASLEGIGLLDFLYVDPSSQRKGIATAFLNHLKQCSVQQGGDRLTTYASKIAKPFFTRHGFQLIRENQVERDGVTLVNYIMELPIR